MGKLRFALVLLQKKVLSDNSVSENYMKNYGLRNFNIEL
jgi:hypothetical protein